MAHRPLSPHLTIYRFAYTMALSILHRIAGLALALGLIALALWLVAAACGPEVYASFQTFAASWCFQVVVALWVLAFVYHLANGIRHLFWDAGKGLERAQARRSAVAVLVAVVVIAAPLLYFLFCRGVS